MNVMTIYQEAYQLISQLPDESVRHLVNLLKSMTQTTVLEHPGEKYDTTQTPMRIGAGKGIIVDSPDFDKWDAEVAELFEGDSI